MVTSNRYLALETKLAPLRWRVNHSGALTFERTNKHRQTRAQVRDLRTDARFERHVGERRRPQPQQTALVLCARRSALTVRHADIEHDVSFQIAQT